MLDWYTTYLARPETQDYEPLVLTREQAQFVLRFYELNPVTGKRIVRRGVISRSRGWGKSPITGGIAIGEGMGPVVPDGWDADGKPVGRPLSDFRKPLIEIAAVSEDQVNTNTWSPLLDMITNSPAIFDDYPGLEPMQTFVNLPYGRIQKRTAEALSAKGAPAWFVVADQALSLDTPIPTPSGWTSMGELKTGDVIYGSQGLTRVAEAKPVMYDHDCYRVEFSDGTWVTASAGHLWQTRIASWPAKANAPKIRTTEEMFKDGRRFRIPVGPAREMPVAEHEVPPYLLGLWLGDGTRGKCEISVGETDLVETQRILSDLGVETWARRYERQDGAVPAVNLTFTRGAGYQAENRPAAAKALAALPCYRVKHIPDEFLVGSIEERTQLLRGLMDSDGSVSKTGSCVFITTSANLAAGMITLLRSLGQVVGSPRWRTDSRYTGGGKWLIHFTPRDGFQPFALPRKASRVQGHRRGPDWVTITEIEPVPRVPVRCIAVEAEDHLFAFGVAGHLTHNTESWTTSNGGKKLYNTLKNNVNKRGGHMLESPNAFTPGADSVAEDTMTTYQMALAGKSKIEDAGVLVDHREAPPDTDLGDIESLMHGLAVAYGDSADIPHCVIHSPPCENPGWVDLEHIAAGIMEPDPNMDVQLQRSDWLNQITHATDSWLSQPVWRACLDASKVMADRDMITLGFDGSRGKAKGKPDATALIGCRVNDGHLFEIGVWEAGNIPSHDPRRTEPARKPGCNCWKCWEPPIVEIEAELQTAFTKYRVAAFYADPGKDWRSHINAWEATYASKTELRPGAAHPFEWWMTGGRSSLVERAILQLEGAIRNKDITHDGTATLTRHMLNARRRLSHGKLSLAKENDYSPNKIDAAVAAVLAYQARLDALSRVVEEPSQFYVPRKLY
jgi:hypothetical protein